MPQGLLLRVVVLRPRLLWTGDKVMLLAFHVDDFLIASSTKELEEKFVSDFATDRNRHFALPELWCRKFFNDGDGHLSRTLRHVF